jgi:hypothetical protein
MFHDPALSRRKRREISDEHEIFMLMSAAGGEDPERAAVLHAG